MFEVFGRSERKYDAVKLKKIHRINGIVYLLLFVLISFLCLDFIYSTKTELSPRASLHVMLALTIVVLFAIKIAIVKVYRQFYIKVQTIGLLIAVMTIVMVGMTGGYYLLISKFGTAGPVKSVKEEAPKDQSKKMSVTVRTDSESIKRGQELYDNKCSFCHDPHSNETIVGPGHKDLLKNPSLPVSKRETTPENIQRQIRKPFNEMPSFDYLSDEEVLDIIAFLNTL
jgi:mono/diheme cytochrome c family protein